MNFLIYLTFSYLISLAYFHSPSLQNSIIDQKEHEIYQIDERIETYRQMGFLNQNLLNSHALQHEKDDLLQKLKFSRFTSTKIDMSDELRQIQISLQTKGLTYLNKNPKQTLLARIIPIPTVGISSKRFEGLNFYTYLVLQSFNNFYSFQGQKLYSLSSHDIDSLLKKYDKFSLQSSAQLNNMSPIMITSNRNENLYIAQYIESQFLDCSSVNLKITQMQIKKKEFIVSDKAESKNSVIESISNEKNSLYSHFFTYSSYQNKRVYYILANNQNIHFYFYSQMAESLVLDHNKTITVDSIFGQLDQSRTKVKINKVIKLNTQLVILTNNNQLFSVNLLSLIMKKPQYIFLYEFVSRKFEHLHQIKFNDNDYKHFYVIGDRNLYRYQVSTTNIIKKYPLRQQLCSDHKNNHYKCTSDIWMLENLIIVQQKKETKQELNHEYFTIQKNSRQMKKIDIPFSHQRKCSKFKRIFFSKNKNSHYILTLACFIEGKEQRILQSKTQNTLSSYLIMQHLNLQTSNEILQTGQLGGIDFTKFRLPMIVFSIGLVCYITIKRSSKKTPEKIAQQEKQSKKFEEEILQTIKREKQRQQALRMVRQKKQ